MRSLFRSMLVGIVMAATCLSGCNSLGECDETSAQELVYSANGLVATKGQALVHDSCGNGAFCHSSSARGNARLGVPYGMNFDMLPNPKGWPDLIQRREEAWDLVVSGDMPPENSKHEVVGDGDWLFDAERKAEAPKLPALSSNEGKAALRNWLACGAPLVAATSVPAWVQAPADDLSEDAGTAGGDGFDAVFSTILRPSCATAGCHNASAAGSLRMLDACTTHRQLLSSGPCGSPRVVPGDGESLLLQKLESRTPACGGPMPPVAALASNKLASVRAWIEGGAEPPPNCP